MSNCAAIEILVSANYRFDIVIEKKKWTFRFVTADT